MIGYLLTVKGPDNPTQRAAGNQKWMNFNFRIPASSHESIWTWHSHLGTIHLVPTQSFPKNYYF